MGEAVDIMRNEDQDALYGYLWIPMSIFVTRLFSMSGKLLDTSCCERGGGGGKTEGVVSLRAYPQRV